MYISKALAFPLTLFCCVQFHFDQVDSTKVALQYKCWKTCGLNNDTSLLSPIALVRRSRLDCATSCSKSPWCLKYVFAIPGTCLLLLSQDIPCPANVAALPGSQVTTCVKLLPAALAPCRMTRKLISDGGANVVDYETILQMLIVGSNVKLRYSQGDSTYVASTNSFTLSSTLMPPVLATVPVYMTGMYSAKVSVRTFYSNTSTLLEEQYNDGNLPSSTLVANISQWLVQLRCGNSSGNKVKVLSKSSNTTSLTEAVDNGSTINIVMVDSTIRFLAANIIIKSGSIVHAQSLYYEGKKVKLLTVRSSGMPDLASWDYINKVRNENESVTTDFIWYADPCWAFIASTPAGNMAALKSAILSGKRVRVAFNATPSEVIYATPTYIGVNSSDIITAHVTNYIDRKYPGSSPVSSRSHYIMSTDGFLQQFSVQFDSETVLPTDKPTSIITWFTDQQNFTLVHSTVAPLISPNQTTLARLKDKVANGSEIRVKVFQNSSSLHFFTCESLQISYDGSLVKCNVSGQLAVDYFESAMTVTQSSSGTSDTLIIQGVFCSITSFLNHCATTTTTTTTYSPTVNSSCPQFLSISSDGKMTSTISCLESGATPKSYKEMSVSVDWFAAE
ncbi:GPI-anchored protein PB15E9.01c isoform X1 [Biomphalaria glabrata]|nr:GPI-anchored protein PB15E9.01c isoform X1 [Biomphalaria glabrata]